MKGLDNVLLACLHDSREGALHEFSLIFHLSVLQEVHHCLPYADHPLSLGGAERECLRNKASDLSLGNDQSYLTEQIQALSLCIMGIPK